MSVFAIRPFEYGKLDVLGDEGLGRAAIAVTRPPLGDDGVGERSRRPSSRSASPGSGTTALSAKTTGTPRVVGRLGDDVDRRGLDLVR